MCKLFPALLAILLAALPPTAARAAATVTDSHTTATLLAATAGWTPGHPLRLGLRLQLAPDWHTYWSNPGDAGLAPEITVALDHAPASPAPLTFPTPRLLPTGPLMGYGYTGDVLLPFTVNPPAGTAPLAIAVHAEWLVCAAVCVPESADLTLALPRNPQPTPSADAPLFAAADAAMPRPSPFNAALSPKGLLRITGTGIGPRSVARAVFIPDTPGLIDQAAPQPLAVTDGALTLALHPQPALAATTPLAGILVITDPSHAETALLIHATRAAAPVAYRAPPRPGLLRLLLLAVAGGLVLNLMPCVFPILAMKAAALTRHGADRPAGVRRSALLYTAGILAAFTAIGLVTIALRSAGSAAGWGFQFQSPAFVAATAWLLFAVGLNLSGLFEIGATLAGTGQHLAGRGGAFGDVMTGVLAVLVATPCTAPFMGAAVAAALSGPPRRRPAHLPVPGRGPRPAAARTGRHPRRRPPPAQARRLDEPAPPGARLSDVRGHRLAVLGAQHRVGPPPACSPAPPACC